jgi:signal transduction histidine kinase
MGVMSRREHSELLSLAVHEFRTPVTVLAGWTKMLVNEQLGPVSERQKKALVEVQQQCGRLSVLLKELAELAELVDPEHQPLTRDEIPVAALLNEATARLDAGAGVAQTGKPEGLTVQGDRRRLPTALGALIRAVVREQGGASDVAVDVATRQQDGNRFAAIAVGRAGTLQSKNGGPDARFNEYPGGIGLGLPIARRVIEQAGGRIWSSAEGKQLGVVTVLLPLKEFLS